ncbi:MAG: hypothetical protein IJT88_04390 [Kiritimatiellae bacterium]|nr:hypothetical protein [Kiritimatiellia bacterium]
MKKYILPLLPLLAIIVGVVAAFGTGGTDAPPEPVVLGEEDLMEQVEIWRNQYRRMTPGDGPLVQDVGELPAAWEEFGNRWSSAPAERDLATWLVPFSAERQGDTTVIRDADGTVLWSGTTDFAKPGSTNVTITGALVDEADWPFYDAARWEVFRRLHEMDEMHGGMRGTNGPYTNGLRFTNIWMETNGNCRLGLAWESNGVVEVFCRAMHTETWTSTVVYTKDENQVVTNEFTHWRQLDTFHGIPDDWVLLGTTTITNGSGIFTDTNHVPDYDRVKFYAAAALADFDDDGLSDGQEWLGGTSATNGDTDNDGLSDYDERNVYHTDPNKADTDEDGITDGAEVLRELDPLDRDSDHDGLFDGAEDVWQTNPKNPDSDHDGLPDGWEVDNGLVPTNATGANGADGDPDNDGFPNSLEFLLGGGAMNPAWSGEQLAYRLCHLQNGDTQPGLRVVIEDALNCGGANDTRQNVVASLNVPALMECGYCINLAVEGKVEDQNSGYDKVLFEAAADTEFFEGNNNLNGCTMATKCATNQVLIMANSQVRLRYDTVGHMYHTGAYAKVVDATVAAPYGVEVDGPDFLCIGNTAPLSVSASDGGPFTWSVSGEAATISPGGVLTAVTTGVAVVTASNAGGCTGSKTVKVVELQGIMSLCPNLPDFGSFGFNPELFEGGKIDFGEPDRNPPYWWLPGTYANPSSRVHKIFYKYAKTGHPLNAPLDICLDSVLSDYDLPENGPSFHWRLLDGPSDSGAFVETNGLSVRFRNPTKGGLYMFLLEIGVPGGATLSSGAWVLLPKAGGEIGAWLANEVPLAVQRAQAWSNAVAAVAQACGEDEDDFLEMAWIKIASDNFDYQGVAGNPTHRYSFTDADRPAGHQPDPSIPGMAGAKGNGDWDEPSYATLKGVVVHRSKITDLMYAVWGRELGYGLLALKFGAYRNAISRSMWDDDSSQKAIELGSALYDAHAQNGDLGAVLTPIRSAELQTPDDCSGLNDVNLWPDTVPVSSVNAFSFPAMPTNYSYLIQPVTPR